MMLNQNQQKVPAQMYVINHMKMSKRLSIWKEN
jgi:hypothetical protein